MQKYFETLIIHMPLYDTGRKKASANAFFGIKIFKTSYIIPFENCSDHKIVLTNVEIWNKDQERKRKTKVSFHR